MGTYELILLSLQCRSGVPIVNHFLIHEENVLMNNCVIHGLDVNCLSIIFGFFVFGLYKRSRSTMASLLRMSGSVVIATTTCVLCIYWTFSLALGLDPLF